CVGDTLKFDPCLTLARANKSKTYFGLPLTDKAEKDFNSLYYLIKKFWNESTSKPLTNTHAKKIAYKVINSFKELDHLPRAWYQYGGIDIFIFDNDVDYAYSGLPAKIETFIRTTTVEYSKVQYAYQVKQIQYHEEPKSLYEIKEKILSILYSKEFDEHPKNSIFVILKFLKRLYDASPKDSRKEYDDILDAYHDMMFDAYSGFDADVIIKHKRNFILLFEAIWKYIALFNFKKELSEHKYYTEEALKSYFYLDIVQQEDEIIELGTELQCLIPKEEEPSDALYQQIKAIRKKAKPADKVELRKQNEKLEKIRAENGENAYQDELLRRAGLK
ncbi:MAG: hypothetical protein AABY09_05450, partial [Nanoarchaeota archaeon]